MTASRRAAHVLVAALLVLGAACAGAAEPAPLERARSGPTLAEGVAVAAGQRFLDDHVEPDGRVVRHDEGGDTVSEGQAYAMFVAVALEDRERFDAVWGWTKEHLQREDGLLAWRWADGGVVDPMPATDADVDAAHALALASQVFVEPDLAREAGHIAGAVLAHETTDTGLGPTAVAGPWARGGDGADPVVNPSYGAPLAYDVLGRLTGDGTWEALDDSARRVVADAARDTDLAPDWAELRPGAVEPTGPPSGAGEPVHGYDAVRTAVRLATDCEPAGRDLAAAMDDEYDAAALPDGGPAAVLALDGEPLVRHGHPAASVGAAAAALAAGDADDAGRLLSVAEQQLSDDPTYYGSAWVALGRLWLTTERLGGCAGD
ncbi:MAG TPA: glycosyl hydrolase family 8 [Acidimicrobiales bacterium]|nr:glycosyl hydrolase family 8 [Acidimicrobiales bacterium]